MATILPRDANSPACLFVENSRTVNAPWQDVYKRFQIDGVIRIDTKDYTEFPEGKLFTHFNLQLSGHIPGCIYALPKIITHGFFVSPNDEQLPLLDFSQCFIAQCIAVRECIPYEALTEEDFIHSFRHIQNVSALQKEILWRYTQSLPNVATKEILSRGVSITALEIIKRLD
ncbi:MAG: hypothetical protein WAV46_03075 [Candidatus Moraniibacteriota bacterium]